MASSAKWGSWRRVGEMVSAGHTADGRRALEVGCLNIRACRVLSVDNGRAGDGRQKCLGSMGGGNCKQQPLENNAGRPGRQLTMRPRPRAARTHRTGPASAERRTQSAPARSPDAKPFLEDD